VSEDALREALQRIAQVEHRQRDAERIAQIGSWEWNLTTGVLRWSEELCRIFGVDPNVPPSYELWMDRIHPEDRERVRTISSQGIEKNEPYEFAHRLVLPDGTERVVYCHGAKLPAREGSPERIVGTSLDITERSRADAERERLHETTRRALASRDEFISIASHELQTPVAALLLAVQGLARIAEASSPREQELLKVAERSAQRVATLAERLLDSTKLRAGKLELQVSEMDLAEVARETVQRFVEPLAAVGSTITLVAEAPVVGLWDRGRLEQVLTNLLTNTIKYAPGKPVRVEVSRIGPEARLEVVDEGIGIPSDRLPHIFEPYERAVSSRHYGGLGLGLYVVRTLVEAHGGHVDAASHIGQGTRMTVRLPTVRLPLI
jgi:PAS domain S-box-containing protein